jgi:hypothetical protein
MDGMNGITAGRKALNGFLGKYIIKYKCFENS